MRRRATRESHAFWRGGSPHLAEGFTLIELIVVMTIIALMTAAVVPMYQGSMTYIQRDRAIRDFAALMKYAQERAITDATEYRFYFREEQRDFWVMRLARMDGDEKEFAFPDEGATEVRQLPETVKLDKPKARYDKDREAHYVAFYASGACDYAKIFLESDDDTRITLETKGRLGQFEVKEK